MARDPATLAGTERGCVRSSSRSGSDETPASWLHPNVPLRIDALRLILRISRKWAGRSGGKMRPMPLGRISIFWQVAVCHAATSSTILSQFT
jgi:hypothetical protein